MLMSQIDHRLNDIDDCLYRVAVRALIVQGNKILLVKEAAEKWWAFPGGGVDHGEVIESALIREVEEELGVSPQEISSDFQIEHCTIGNVLNGIPRMNLYIKVSIPESSLKRTEHVTEWGWFGKEDFLKLDLHVSYDKNMLVRVIFDE